jgi:type III pantothenate kinase
LRTRAEAAKARILAVDAGNSRIKWGVYEGGEWLVQGAVATARAGRLRVHWSRLPRPDAVICANVAGARTARALAAAARGLGHRVRFVRSAAAQCGVRSAYRRPGTLGPDRWAALIGAWHLYRGPCVVAGAGTALTVDALSSEGVFLGGFIVPGERLMRAALARHTAALGLRSGRYTYFPVNTADAIASGALNALAGAIERMERHMRQAGQAVPLLVVSGGAARLIAPLLNGAVEVVDNLVLEGLVRIAREP